MEYNSSYQPYQLNRYSHHHHHHHHHQSQQQHPTNTISGLSSSLINPTSSSVQGYPQVIPQQQLHQHQHQEIPQVRYLAEQKVSTVSSPSYIQTGAQILYPPSLNQVATSNHLNPPPPRAPPPSASTSPQTHHHPDPYPHHHHSSANHLPWSLKTPLNAQSAAATVRQQYQQVLPPISVPYPYSAAAAAAACGSSDSSSPTAYPYPHLSATLTDRQQREQNQQRRHIQQQNSQLNEQFIFPHLIHQRQRGLQPIQRRWYLWAIGILDIIAVVWTTSLVIRDAFLKPIADPNEFIWYFFWTSLVILARFTMGMCLIIGLHSSDDPSTLWYCKMWMWCQYFVFVMLLPELFTSFADLVNSPADTLWQKSIPLKFLLVLAAVSYRVLCYLLVKKFINRLEKCESVFLDRVHQRQMQEDRDRRRSQDQGDGETSFCGPSIALIMSL